MLDTGASSTEVESLTRNLFLPSWLCNTFQKEPNSEARFKLMKVRWTFFLLQVWYIQNVLWTCTGNRNRSDGLIYTATHISHVIRPVRLLFQSGLINQPTLFSSHNKPASAGLISPETNQRTGSLSDDCLARAPSSRSMYNLEFVE